MNKRNFFALVALVALTGSGCMNSNPGAAGGVENGNPVLSGAVHDEQGTATEDAIIKLIPYDNNPQLGSSVTAATVTDAKGVYSFDDVNDGTYTIIGETPDGSLSFIDTITIEQTSSKTTENVAKSPGKFQGVVKLEPYRSGMVLIALLGTNVYTTTTDAIGNFTTPNIPEGNYRVLIISTQPEFADTQITVDVVSDETTILDTIALGYSNVVVDISSIQILNEANAHLAGSYLGTVTASEVPPYTVTLTIEDNGHYSAYCVTTDELPTFQRGTDADDPRKKISLTDINMLGGIIGTIEIVFDDGGTTTDSLKNLRFNAAFDTLSFEAEVGSSKFMLHRISPDAVPPRPPKTPAMPTISNDGRVDPNTPAMPLTFLDSLTITLEAGVNDTVIYQILVIANRDSLFTGTATGDALWRDDLPYLVYNGPFTIKGANNYTMYNILTLAKNGSMRSHANAWTFAIKSDN